MEGHWVAQVGALKFNMDTLTTMWIAMAVLIIFALLATRNLSVIPGKLQAFAESIMEFFYGLTDSMIGKEGGKHIPIVASLFLFILVANLMGQLPWRLYHLKDGGELASPTNDINLTAGLAVIVLVYYLFVGIKKKGFGFLFHGFSFDKIVLTLVELLEMITRPLSLALRLFANILAGEILVVAGLGMFAYLLPVPIMLFELLVAFIQAFVFMMLTMAYISSSISEEH